ncbi:MAG: NAD(P)/FAD-dependent oxidoreductase [Myxococcota bacterium]
MSSPSEDPKPGLPDDFDATAMRERYRAERDKRLRPDGNDQYIEVVGDFARYLEDPYVEQRLEREVLTEDVEVLVIGGGFGGLQMGARLRDAGIEDLRIIEKGGDFGGTWYWNRYPGAQCDIESYIYLPLLEEVGYIPTEKYAFAKEILEYSQKLGRHYGLYEGALFETEVTDLTWDDEASRWIVTTDRGDTLRARFVTMANGPLNRPKLPGIPGVEDFAGHTFHTSRWDYDYTGGGPLGGLDRLHDKTVAVIGTGATGIQCVPFLGETAKQLYVFRRTPSSVDVRGNKPTDPDWAASLDPGWHKQRMENFNGLVSGVPQPEDLVDDGWTDLIGKMIRRFKDAMQEGAPDVPKILEMANFEKMNEIRQRVDELVDDPAVAEKLKPYYQMFCKRPTFNDDFLPTFNPPNVELVDTDGQGVERITEKGLVVAGVEYEVDCIIYATGFEVGTAYSRRAGYQIRGRGGRTLEQKWEAGMQSLHGMQSHDFPNCFVMHMLQAAFTANFPHLLEEQTTHIAYIVGHALEVGATKVEVTREAEEAWAKLIIEKGAGALGALGGPECTPGYYNNEGQERDSSAAQAVPYGGGSIEFFELLAKWRASGDFEGLEFGRSEA